MSLLDRNSPEDLVAFLEANRVRPSEMVGKTIVLYSIAGGRATIMHQGLVKSCDGVNIVLGDRPDDYERIAGGAVLLDSREDTEPDRTIRLAGLNAADGEKYREWNDHRGLGRRLH